MTPRGLFTPAPPVTGLVRPRLVHALQGSTSAARLGLVVAPPGTGKTTLLTHWAAQNFGSVAWHRSGPPDAEPGRMLARFAAAVATAANRERARSFPELAAMAHALTVSLCFVVDDWHVVAGTCAEAELEQLLSLGCPQVHFLIGSRRPPALNLARSELPSLVKVDWDDLRFRAPEVEQLFRTTYKQPLSTAGVYNLTQRTDGWAAALHLFHVATKSRSTVERRRAAESLGPVPRYAHDYLTHHYFAGVPPQLERLLRHTCLLERLTPSRCNALLGVPDSGLLLHEAEQLGVVASDGGGTAFRVPKVVRRYLVATLGDGESLAPENIRRRTAALLEQEGAHGAALQILAECGDWDHVRATMERAGSQAFRAGTCGWVTRAPESLIRKDALFALAKARQLLDDGYPGEARMVAAAIPHPAVEPWHEAAALLQQAAAEWTGEQRVSSCGPVSILRAALHGSPGSAARSVTSHNGAEDTLARGLALLIAGDQRGALPFLRRCAEQPDDETPAALWAQLALAVFTEEPQTPGVDVRSEEIDAVQRRAERLGFSWLARIARGVLCAQSGNAGGQPAVQSAIENCEQHGDDWGAALIAAATALGRLRNGRPDYSALDVLANKFRKVGASALEAWALSTRALVGAAQDLPEAIEEALAAEAFARTADVPGARAVAYAALAQLKPEQYADLMEAAAETARTAGFVCRPWTWIAMGSGIGAAPLVRSQQPVPLSGDGTVPGSGPVPPPVLDVHCFGEFSLRADGVDIDLSRVRPQARTVLRILSLHAGRPVHRDRLAATLWADLDAASALHNLQVSVSSLRRALQPAGLAGNCQLLVRRGEAYALVLDSRSRIDLLEFDQAVREAGQARSAGNLEGAATFLHRAVDLYAGEVLPEDGPAEWLFDTRERYRLRAAEAAATLAILELDLGKTTDAAAAAARSVEIDPWRDESWRTLISVYRSSGDLAAAERAERRYRGMLNALGVPPDAKLQPLQPGK
jgi:ATP/maltotriose-dependent transcriptional regulator MalT/DNA-binding SARP family transcriptional activator